MKASLSLWRQWSAQLRQLLPDVHGHRSKTLAFFVFGLVLAGKACLPLIAEELPGDQFRQNTQYRTPPHPVLGE